LGVVGWGLVAKEAVGLGLLGLGVEGEAEDLAEKAAVGLVAAAVVGLVVAKEAVALVGRAAAGLVVAGLEMELVGMGLVAMAAVGLEAAERVVVGLAVGAVGRASDMDAAIVVGGALQEAVVVGWAALEEGRAAAGWAALEEGRAPRCRCSRRPCDTVQLCSTAKHAHDRHSPFNAPSCPCVATQSLVEWLLNTTQDTVVLE
jgi:hypothetical protein